MGQLHRGRLARDHTTNITPPNWSPPSPVVKLPPWILQAWITKGRQRRLRSSLPAHRLDALLVTHLPNILYLCGFRGSAGALLLTEAKSVFFTDGRYTTQARSEVRGAQIVIGRKPPLVAAAEWLAKHGHNKTGRGASRFRAGIDGEHMPVAARTRLAANLPPNLRLLEAPELVERARMVKDAREIERIRATVLLGAVLFERALEVIRPGVRETEVAAEMEYAAREAGAEAMSFPTIIASGERSALPHGRASRAAVPARDSWSATSVLYSPIIVPI